MLSSRLSNWSYVSSALLVTTVLFSNDLKSKFPRKQESTGEIVSLQGWWPIANNTTNNGDVVTSPFGPRGNSYDFHEGIDIRAQYQNVHTAYDATYIVEVIANSNNAIESYVKLRHVNPNNLSDPNDDIVFFTFYNHLDYTDDLMHLAEIVDDPSARIVAGVPNTYTDPNTGRTHYLNPFAISGNSGVRDANGENPGTGTPHLHFEKRVGNHVGNVNSRNPMGDAASTSGDALPYTNFGAPELQNPTGKGYQDLVTGRRLLSFTVRTPAQELDLNRIRVFIPGDTITVDFNSRQNCDVAYVNPPPGGDEDGIINTTTSSNIAVTITITTHNFDPMDSHQIMDFEYDLPALAQWPNKFVKVRLIDTQNLTYTSNDIQVGSVALEREFPIGFSIAQNYPNPFNPLTEFRFGLHREGKVKALIFNTTGEQVRVLLDEVKRAGEHSVIWDAKNGEEVDVASGVYFYEFSFIPYETSGQIIKRRGKMTLIR